jgi:hypothetical protein
LLDLASSAWHRSDERSFRKSTFVLQIFSTVEAQGANGRFQVGDRDGAMTEMERNVAEKAHQHAA